MYMCCPRFTHAVTALAYVGMGSTFSALGDPCRRFEHDSRIPKALVLAICFLGASPKFFFRISDFRTDGRLSHRFCAILENNRFCAPPVLHAQALGFHRVRE